MGILGIISGVAILVLCLLAFHKNESVRVWGRVALGIVFLFLLSVSCYLVYLGLWAPNRGNGIGPGIFLFIAVLPILFTFITGGLLKESFNAESEYWNKSEEERKVIDEKNREMAKEELKKILSERK